MNCIYAQGYYFYKPMPISDAEDLLTTVPHEEAPVLRKIIARLRNTADAFHATLVTHSIFKILAENSLVLARLNLNNGEYEILKEITGSMDVDLKWTRFRTYSSHIK